MTAQPTTDAIAELLDREHIRDVLHRYVDRVDALDLDGVTALFTENVSVDLLGTQRAGPEKIARHLGRALGGFERTSHHPTAPVITVRGDAGELSAGVYAYHRRADGSVWHFWGRYRMQLVRTAGGWLVTHLELVGVDGGPDSSSAERDLYAGHPDRRTHP